MAKTLYLLYKNSFIISKFYKITLNDKCWCTSGLLPAFKWISGENISSQQQTKLEIVDRKEKKRKI